MQSIAIYLRQKAAAWLSAFRGQSDASLSALAFSPPGSRVVAWMIDPGTPVSDGVRAKLRAYLFGNIAIWSVGVANMQFVNALAAWRHPGALFVGFAAAVFLLDLVRTALFVASLRRARAGGTTRTGLFLTLDLVWLWCVGLSTLLVMTTQDSVLQLLVVASDIAISGGLVVRSYIAPRSATLQLVGCLAPLWLAAILHGDVVLLVLAAQIPVYLWVTSDGAFRINRIFVATMVAEERNQARAERDGLTGLANRTVLDALLPRLCAAGAPFALLYLDLDGFKAVNDRFGHGAGDQLLMRVADRLRQGVRGEDRVARLGGDEFVLVLIGAEEPAARARAAAIVALLSEPYALGEATARVGASVGIACGPAAGVDAATLLTRADTALYRAKAAGKGRCVAFCDPAPEAATAPARAA